MQKALVGLALVVMFLAVEASAAVWTGAVDNLWTTAGNWSGTVPTQFGVQPIDFHSSGAGNLNTNVNTGGQFFVSNVSTNANATSFAINNTAGGQLAVSGDVFINSGAANLAAAINYPIFFNKVANTTLTFDVAGAGRSLAVHSVLRHVSSGLANGQTVIKTGSGSMTLSAGATSTYRGDTNVDGGTLEINGTLDSQISTVNVNNTATLRGTGTVNRSVTVNGGGTLAPGGSIGTFNTGDVSLTASTSTLAMEIDLGGTPTADLLNVAGAINLGSGNLNLTLLNAPGFSPPITILLASNNLTDGITGTFSSITGLPGNYSAIVNYAFTGTDSLGRTGDGNDLAVTLTAVPEAGAFLLVGAIGVGACIVQQIRRSRKDRRGEAG